MITNSELWLMRGGSRRLTVLFKWLIVLYYGTVTQHCRSNETETNLTAGYSVMPKESKNIGTMLND